MVTTDKKLFEETLKSIEKIGGKLHKFDGNDIYFLVKKDSKLGKDLKTRRGVRDYLMSEFEYKMFVGLID